MTQKQVARVIGVEKTSIHNWESNTTSPDWHYWGPIAQFLGYDPFPPAITLAERLSRFRRIGGRSQEFMAKRLGVDPGTLRRWESGKNVPSSKFLNRIESFLTGNIHISAAGAERIGGNLT